MRRKDLAFVGVVLLCLCAVLSGGCSPKPLVKDRVPMGAFRRPEARIIHLSSGRQLTFDRLVEELGQKRVVFIGEIHDNPEHHLVQVQILQALTARHGFDRVAMEFFEQVHQDAVDRYLRGEWRESRFLEAVEWNKTWGYDYSLYRPLVLLTKHHGARLLAINAPGSVVKKVARQGLGALNPSERALIARDLDLGNQRHRRFVRRVFSSHTHPDLKDFEFFYQAQCVWEETMARNIAASLKSSPAKVVVLCGNGHIIHGLGIPDRVSRRIAADMATVLLYPAPGLGDLEKGSGDYVWLTGRRALRTLRPRRGSPGGG